MTLILPLNAMAVDAIGMMTTVGTVTVNDRPVTNGGAVFAGEVIGTRNASKAVVSNQGKTISLGENSVLRLGAGELDLESGSVVISSTSSILRVENVTVRAISDTPVKFLARKVNGTVQVLALEGTVTVDDGQQSTQVPATKGVGIGNPGKHLGWLRNDDIGILLVVAAAITAGVVLGIVNAENAKAITPAGP